MDFSFLMNRTGSRVSFSLRSNTLKSSSFLRLLPWQQLLLSTGSPWLSELTHMHTHTLHINTLEEHTHIWMQMKKKNWDTQPSLVWCNYSIWASWLTLWGQKEQPGEIKYIFMSIYFSCKNTMGGCFFKLLTAC